MALVVLYLVSSCFVAAHRAVIYLPSAIRMVEQNQTEAGLDLFIQIPLSLLLSRQLFHLLYIPSLFYTLQLFMTGTDAGCQFPLSHRSSLVR